MNADRLIEQGNALYRRGDLAAASASYRAALIADAGNARAHYNLGVILQEGGRLDEARAHYLEALAARPDMGLARSNLAVIDLFGQDFAAGWDGYELRFDTGGVALRPNPLPRLDPANLSSAHRVAVRREQGIGDQILFSTLLPELPAHGLEAIVEVDRRLLEAYRRSLPAFEFVTKVEAPLAFERCDHQVPFGSLPRLFRRSAESFLAQPQALLAADAARSEAIARAVGEARRIAISWRTFQPAGREHIERARSIPLAHFGALDDGATRLVDVQYGDVSGDRREFDARHPGVRASIPGLDPFEDLDGVLAAIAACELVVTPSNVTAHLAGILGKRTWLLYLGARAPFHYWVPGPDGRCLWYPSVEIVTDPGWERWEQAFEAIAARLAREGS